MFQYEPYRSELTGTIAQLMLGGARAHAQAAREAGAAQARAAEMRGQNAANLAGSLGQIISGTANQIGQYYSPEAKAGREMQGLQLDAAKTQVAQAKAEDVITQRLQALFSRRDEQGQPIQPSPEEVISQVGPERGLKIVQGLDALSDYETKRYDSTQTRLMKVMAGMQALPEPLRAELYPQIRQAMIQQGAIKPEDAPEAYDPSWWQTTIHYGQQPQAPKTPEPFTLKPGDVRFDETGKQIAAVPEPPKEDKHSAAYVEYQDAVASGYKGSFNQYQTEDANRKRPVTHVTVGGSPGTGALTKEGVDFAATQYRVTGVMPSLGMGNSEARAAIINQAAKQAQQIGQTPAAAIQKQASFKADAGSLSKITVLKESAQSFETKARAQAEKVVELSNKVGRSKWPIVNTAILAGKREVAGDPDATLLLNAVITFGAEYAKIIEGSTGSVAASSDSARKAADRLLNPKMNQGTVTKVVDLMKWEMEQTIKGYDATIASISERMGGQAQQPQAPTPQARRVYYDANGNPMKK